ncbi:Sm domain-containing protein [Aphelenchoides fujianensis]|nr:Sm domain-containing protein [Aphelenchoides fujianensis]
MSVTLHTSVGDLKFELYCERCPRACEVRRLGMLNNTALNAAATASAEAEETAAASDDFAETPVPPPLLPHVAPASASTNRRPQRPPFRAPPPAQRPPMRAAGQPPVFRRSPHVVVSRVPNGTSADAARPPRTVAKWLNRRLKLELVDGRSVCGEFVLTDNSPNLILAHAEEWWGHDGRRTGAPASARQVGSVMIRGEHVLRIYETPV